MIRFLFSLFFVFFSFTLQAELLDQCGKGFLESSNDQLILHLKGSPYEMGYQHGQLLKEKIAQNISRFVEKKPVGAQQEVIANFLISLPKILPHIPARFIIEMQGIADGSGIPYEKILLLNLTPEMFHCSGITVSGKATTHEELYHVRVLDYSAGKNLQNSAVLIVAEPEIGHAFLNVTYAGFIGSVTGMNDQKIAVGEIGGKGYGLWNGVPMAFLLRSVLEKTSSLEEIKSYLTVTPRTCEYYYVFSDGKTKESIGVYATPCELDFITSQDTFILSCDFYEDWDPSECPKLDDCLIITRQDKYFPLLSRLTESYGKIGIPELQSAIRRPVAQETNLHNAIFAPTSLEVWISHASQDNQPACDQPYHRFNLEELLSH